MQKSVKVQTFLPKEFVKQTPKQTFYKQAAIIPIATRES